jgi:hypothetical protein
MLSVNHSPHIRVFSKIETFLQAWVGMEKAQIVLVTRRWIGRPCDPLCSSMYMMMMMMVPFHINFTLSWSSRQTLSPCKLIYVLRSSPKTHNFTHATLLHSGLYFVVWNESPPEGWLNPTALLISKAQLIQDCTHVWWGQRGPAPTTYPPTYLLTIHNSGWMICDGQGTLFSVIFLSL